MSLGTLHGWKRTTILSWNGPLPAIGEYLMSARPRYAYRVMTIEPATRPGVRYVAKAWLERLAPDAVPAGSVVHEWAWARR